MHTNILYRNLEKGYSKNKARRIYSLLIVEKSCTYAEQEQKHVQYL